MSLLLLFHSFFFFSAVLCLIIFLLFIKLFNKKIAIYISFVYFILNYKIMRLITNYKLKG